MPLLIGYFLSSCWILFFAFYYSRNFIAVNELQPNNLGDLLAGVFAPLAFLWLFVATLLQKKELEAQREELSLNRKVLALQAEELRNSVAQLKAQAQILEKQFKAQSQQQTLEDIRERIAGLCSILIVKVGGDSSRSTSGSVYRVNSFLSENGLREMQSDGNLTFLLEEINRRLSRELRILRENAEKGLAIEVRKRPSIEDVKMILDYIDRTLKIPEVSGTPELSEKFDLEYPLRKLREHVVVIRDYVTLPGNS